MIAEFTIVPIGGGESLSKYVAEAVKIVESSGLRYQVTATCTIVEGGYQPVMDVIGECHRKVLSMSNRVMTMIRIDDRLGAQEELESKVQSVEDKLGHTISQCAKE